jgi:hypothetical protein
MEMTTCGQSTQAYTDQHRCWRDEVPDFGLKLLKNSPRVDKKSKYSSLNRSSTVRPDISRGAQKALALLHPIAQS